MQISEETIRLVEEAIATRQMMPNVTRGITISSNDIGYDLEAPAKVIVPVQTPLVNMLPRKPGPGINITNWKAITAFDTSRSWGTLSGNNVPTAVTYSFVSLSNNYHTIALSNSVDFEAQWYGRSFEGDVRARRLAELLYQVKITEERWLLQASAKLMVPPAPVLSTTTSGGAALDSTTYYVTVTAVNANGETTQSSATSITTGNSGSNVNTLKVTLFTVPNATYYNVYIGTNSAAARTTQWLQSSISGNSNAPQPSVNVAVSLNGGGSTACGEVQAPTVGPLSLTASVASSGTNPPSTNGANTFQDSNSNTTMWDGLISQGLLNAGTGNGLTLGTQVAQPAATNGVLALSDIDNLLVSAYNQAAADPDVLIMNSIVHRKLTNLVAQANQTRYVVDSTQGQAQGNLTAQYRVTHYLNEATGKEIPIVVDRYCPADTIVALPMSIPYPVPEISNAVEIEVNQEYWGIDFAITNSSFQFADYVNETLKVYFLGGLCVLRGITPAV